MNRIGDMLEQRTQRRVTRQTARDLVQRATAPPAQRDNTLAAILETSAVALPLREDLTNEEWWKVGQRLAMARHNIIWKIGDWLRFGERKYGKTYDEAAALLGYSKRALQDAVWLCGRIESSRRREDLSVGHHRTVAPLDDPDTQDQLLEAAARGGWSVRELQTFVQQMTSGVIDAEVREVRENVLPPPQTQDREADAEEQPIPIIVTARGSSGLSPAEREMREREEEEREYGKPWERTPPVIIRRDPEQWRFLEDFKDLQGRILALLGYRFVYLTEQDLRQSFDTYSAELMEKVEEARRKILGGAP